ncbi:MAG: endonuclease III [Planctomycetota bacterium]
MQLTTEPVHSLDENRQKEFLARLDMRLLEAYGPREFVAREPLDELVLTILSQNTNDRNRDKAFNALKSAFPTWESVSEASLEELMQLLKPAGLAPQKAPRIQNIVKRALSGELPLKDLKEMVPDEARKRLLAEDGVGVKTAHCVLLFSYDMPVFPMDTHILRVFARLGVIPEKHNVEREHVRLSSYIASGRHKEFHLNVIRHGQLVCKARNPLCHSCSINDLCAYYISSLSKGD